MASATTDSSFASQGQTEKAWLHKQHNTDGTIMKPDQLEKLLENPPKSFDISVFDRIHGSMVGMALGDALGAHVEFRPHEYLVEHPVTDLQGGGTWGLSKGQFTDDTSMALCLANSLIVRQDYDPYDQLVRYKWWFREGYMSSTGKCFDIGSATKHSLLEFERRQRNFAEKYHISFEDVDFQSDLDILDQFKVKCSEEGVAGNGALMRLAPVPLFFYKHPIYAVEYSGHSGEITHGDQKAYDACRYYGALIVAAVRGANKKQLLSENFCEEHKEWFGNKPLHADVLRVASGSYKKERGYDAGIRGKGYIVAALEAALWAFWSDKDSFETGVLAAVNLGDDTDTTAAIYGQLAGAYYGYKKLPSHWVEQVYANQFIACLSKWLTYEGQRWSPKNLAPATNPSLFDPQDDARPRRRSFVQDSLASNISDEGPRPRGKTVVENSSTLDVPDERPRLRGKTVVENSSTVKRPTVHEPPSIYRPKSSDLKNLELQPQRLYFHDRLNSVADVCEWVKGLGDEYVTYAKLFKYYGVDGYWLLNCIDDKVLSGYGIQNKGHQRGILDGIEKLRDKCPIKYSTLHKTAT
ncbi:unnamed protein product [Adineta ricciae]|uniref:SAM domain-containing protein n=1 Tax=Adineta ricciae TaxID=249248 RepID=A0A813VBJ8_ADIRI|nr:unnamed protein product [Adineta ricciae]CAF1260513.1 unnamed protein product [Adineta ricciae]